MEILLTLTGTIIGFLITLLVAKHYYEKASKDLAVEAKELKRLNILMLRGLEAAGMVDFSRDNEGNIKGMVIKVSGIKRSGPASMSGVATVIPKVK